MCFQWNFGCRFVENIGKESVLSKTQDYDWYKAFKEGRKVCEELSHPAGPSTSNSDENINHMKKIVMENH